MLISVLIYYTVLLGLTFARCPIGAIQGLDPNTCYFYRTEPSSWYDAEEECVQLNGHLASVSNAFVNSFISRSWYHAPENYWLGATVGNSSSEAWSWTDGTGFTYSNWAEGSRCFRSGAIGTSNFEMYLVSF